MLPPVETISALPSTLRLRVEKSAKMLFVTSTREFATLLKIELAPNAGLPPPIAASAFPAKVQWLTTVWTNWVEVSFST